MIILKLHKSLYFLKSDIIEIQTLKFIMKISGSTKQYDCTPEITSI